MKLKEFRIASIYTCCILLMCLFSHAQSPERVSYQSVIRDASGDLVRSQPVTMKISILQGSVSGTAVYVEFHSLTTNVNGLASVEVGSGKTKDDFSVIDWSNGPYFLKVETDPDGGSTYTISGTSEILSVPYALYAKTAETVEAESQGLADVLGESNDGNAVQIKNIASPTDDQDAATKAYVDVLLERIEALELLNDGFTDTRDGNHYDVVKIGTQVWMAENLAWLPEVSPPDVGSEDGDETKSYYYVYGYSGTDVSAAKATANYTTYGVLYNWPAATAACPSGWHLPTDAEWTTLTDYLTNNGYGYGGSGDDIGKTMASTSGWTTYSTPGTIGNDQASNNSSGFSGLPGGYRFSTGDFRTIGYSGYWWSATEYSASHAWTRALDYHDTSVLRYGSYKDFGFSVRCVRDN